MRRPRHAITALCALMSAASLAMLGCGSDVPTVPRSEIPGIYMATMIAISTDSTSVDLYREGGTIDLRLAPDGSTGGTALIPLETGFDTNEDLSGTWSYADGTVTLKLNREFLLELSLIPFTARREGLSGTREADGHRIVIELTKVAPL